MRPAAPQAPRIAVMDPLADMRMRNLSKPDGLGANSDWPSKEQIMASGNTGMPLRPGLSQRDSEVSSDGAEDYSDGANFNWSDDEAVEESAKFEEEIAQQRKVKIGRISLWAIIRFLGVTFLGNLIISSLLIVPVLVIQFVYRPAGGVSTQETAHKDYVADNIQAWFIWAAFNLHVMWWLHFSVGLIPRVGILLVQIVWGTANQRVKTYAEVYNAIKAYISPITYAAMSWASWATLFNPIFGLYNQTDPSHSRGAYLYRIYQVVEFFFFVILTICVEKIIIKCIAMSFHKSAYAERIETVTNALRTFDRLKDYRPKWKDRNHSRSGRATPLAFSANGPGSGVHSPIAPPSASLGKRTHAKKRPAMPHSSVDLDAAAAITASMSNGSGQTSGGTSPTVTARGGKGAAKIARMPVQAIRSGASTVRTGAGKASRIARVALTDPFSLLSSKTTGVGADVNSPQAAKRLAKTIFRSFRGHHRRSYLIPSDFEPAFATVQEARAAFAVFDRDGNGDISQSEIKNTVLATYKERRFLSKSMQDVNHAVGQLERIFYFVVFVILMFEAFAIFDVDISKTLTTFYTLGIAFAFIFKESAQNVFDSIIFLFVTHPFDTGDRIAITKESTTVVMAVKRMSLLSSEFTLADNTDMYVANSVLASIMITNYRRSGYQWESVAIQVAFDTPLQKLDAVEADMIHWLSTEPERMFEPTTAIVPQKINYMRSIECTVGMTHRRTWQDWGMRWYCRNAFVAALCYYMKKHGIRYAQPNQPIIYWCDDAAQLPPSYDNSSSTPAQADGEGGYHAMYDDSFDQSPPPSPGTGAHGAAAATSGVPPAKVKSFMGFALPADELDGTGLRKRRAKSKSKGVAIQGGDG
ncbi:hypothetical protein K437DRAFT_248471 [Tilletiaria anomala UBC 951]|uniref:EF-hand domain-containing protein n=1 Tax=Tilletiaria anomala (strain ATCC 24038 / CBS 436.72 / UBC 951) TaxID=1037660 RepID=A0A066VT43_TILAU|nr:uncharacterized protein K437DRAFT_248471 [Tilletiaria anomala UBC 951]KDN43438.1 hypothetical protein K437DRAFT_248471 [Tilletiaria anomala UBC 951]